MRSLTTKVSKERKQNDPGTVPRSPTRNKGSFWKHPKYRVYITLINRDLYIISYNIDKNKISWVMNSLYLSSAHYSNPFIIS